MSTPFVISSMRNNLQYSVIKFPSGELQVNFAIPAYIGDTAYIKGSILSSDDLIILLQIVQLLRHHNADIRLYLVLPYLPYSRSDKLDLTDSIMGGLNLKLFASLINSCNFTGVTTWDEHSSVTSALINNCTSLPVTSFLPASPAQFDYIIAPDAGAVKRASLAAAHYKIPMYIATKHRDPETGALSNPILHGAPTPLSGIGLIVDDICQAGGTFIQLVQTIKQTDPGADIRLFVTHAFLTKGIEPLLSAGITGIYTTSSVIPAELKASPLVTITK